MAIKDRLELFEQKIDKILERQNNINIKLEKCYHTIYGESEKGLTKKVEELEEVTSKHSRYFWFLGVIFSFLGFIANKILDIIIK